MPPAVVLLSVVVDPTQVVSVPVIGFGGVFTVTVRVLMQPVPNV